MSGMVFVTLLCCRLLRYVCADYVGVNVFHVCLNLASSMVLGSVSMSVV